MQHTDILHALAKFHIGATGAVAALINKMSTKDGEHQVMPVQINHHRTTQQFHAKPIVFAVGVGDVSQQHAIFVGYTK